MTMRWLRMVTVRAQASAAAQYGGMGGGPQGTTSFHRRAIQGSLICSALCKYRYPPGPKHVSVKIVFLS